MCIVKWMDDVTDLIDVQVEWTGPDGATPPLALDLVKKSLSRYISKVVIHAVKTAHSVKYTCTVHIANQSETIVAKKILAVGERMQMLQCKQFLL